MQIVIDISESDYYRIKDIPDAFDSLISRVYKSIKNGTPLPKKHGKMVDIGRIDEDRIDNNNPIIYLSMNGEYIEAVSLDYLNNLPIIIAAESEDQNE